MMRSVYLLLLGLLSLSMMACAINTGGLDVSAEIAGQLPENPTDTPPTRPSEVAPAESIIVSPAIPISQSPSSSANMNLPMETELNESPIPIVISEIPEIAPSTSTETSENVVEVDGTKDSSINEPTSEPVETISGGQQTNETIITPSTSTSIPESIMAAASEVAQMNLSVVESNEPSVSVVDEIPVASKNDEITERGPAVDYSEAPHIVSEESIPQFDNSYESESQIIAENDEVTIRGTCSGKKHAGLIWYDSRKPEKKGNSSVQCKKDKFEFKFSHKKKDSSYIIVQTVLY